MRHPFLDKKSFIVHVSGFLMPYEESFDIALRDMAAVVRQNGVPIEVVQDSGDGLLTVNTVLIADASKEITIEFFKAGNSMWFTFNQNDVWESLKTVAHPVGLRNFEETFYNLKGLLKYENSAEWGDVSHTRSAWEYCSSLETFPALDFSNSLASVQGMFKECHNLKELPEMDFSGIVDAGALMYKCYELKKFFPKDFSSATGIHNLHGYNYQLMHTPEVSDFTAARGLYRAYAKTNNLLVVKHKSFISATNLTALFTASLQLRSFDGNGIDFTKIVRAETVVSGCGILRSVPKMELTSAGPVAGVNGMFNECTSLPYIPRFATGPAPGSMGNLFRRCHSLLSVPKVDFRNATNIYALCNSCVSLEYFPKADFLEADNAEVLFRHNRSLRSINITLPKATKIGGMFYNARKMVLHNDLIFSEALSTTANRAYDIFELNNRIITLPTIEFPKVVTTFNAVLWNSSKLQGFEKLVFGDPANNVTGDLIPGSSAFFGATASLIYPPTTGTDVRDGNAAKFGTYINPTEDGVRFAVQGFLKPGATEIIIDSDSDVLVEQDTYSTRINGNSTAKTFTGLVETEEVTIYFINKNNTYFKLKSDSYIEVSLSGVFRGLTTLEESFKGLTSMVKFNCYAPLTDITNFNNTWKDCTSLESMPSIDYVSGTDFNSTWANCTSLKCFDEYLELDSLVIGTSAFKNTPSLISPASVGTAIRAGDHAVLGQWENILFCPQRPVKAVFSGYLLPGATGFDMQTDGDFEVVQGSNTQTYTGKYNIGFRKVAGFNDVELITVSCRSEYFTLAQGDYWKSITLESLADDIRTDALTGSFKALYSLETFNVSSPDVTQYMTKLWSTWEHCESLQSFPVINVDACSYFTNAWAYCESLQSFPNIVFSSSMDIHFSRTWEGCKNLLTFPNLNFDRATYIGVSWRYCESLTEFPAISFPIATDCRAAWEGCTSLTKFNAGFSMPAAVSLYRTWKNCDVLQDIDFAIPSTITSIQEAWSGCKTLTSFPLITADNLPTMVNAWKNCINITEHPGVVTAGTTGGVDISGMLEGCTALTKVGSINYSLCSNIKGIFWGCINLECIDGTLDFTNVDVINLDRKAFRKCDSLVKPPPSSPVRNGEFALIGTWTNLTPCP